MVLVKGVARFFLVFGAKEDSTANGTVKRSWDQAHTGKLGINWRWGPWDLAAFLEVTNLYDRQNPCCTEYSLQPGPGGTTSLIAREAHWLPIVPSLGVVWRF